jgi:hypothetical protein
MNILKSRQIEEIPFLQFWKRFQRPAISAAYPGFEKASLAVESQDFRQLILLCFRHVSCQKHRHRKNVSLFSQIEYFCCQIIRGRFQMNYNFKMDKDHPLFQGLVANTKDKRLKIYPQILVS